MLVGRNLKIRYKNSMLGFFWTLLGPLCMIAIYATFAHILRWSDMHPQFLQFLVVGIVMWQFTLMCLNDALYAIMGNANLIKKTAFPRVILPLAMVSANLVNFLLTCAVLTAYLLIVKMSFGCVMCFPLVLLTQCALCLGISLIVSASNVFFRDTEHALSIVALAWFFLSPIFYPVKMQLEMLPDHLGWLAFLNPMTGILCSYRAIFMNNVSATMAQIGVSFAVSWVVLLIGIAVFQKAQVKFGDEL